jgi:nucleotide-binding universal stress UspA family protein
MSVATHILLTTDFSEASEKAATKAGELARTAGARLTVLYVHGHPPGAPEALVDPEKVTTSADLDAEARQALENLQSSKLGDVEFVDLVTLEHASAPLAICDYADKHDIDTIVIGTHGRTGIPRFLIGSVAEKVVRHASCPVFVVPSGEHRRRDTSG